MILIVEKQINLNNKLATIVVLYNHGSKRSEHRITNKVRRKWAHRKQNPYST